MTTEIALTSIASGVIVGLIYGCSFALQQRSIFFSRTQTTNAILLKLRIFILFTIRIATLGLFVHHALRSPQIDPILTGVAFITTFWTFILRQKGTSRA